ncbi:MAG: thymidylate synthase [Candidatus Odinarchaeota archaeon]
MYFVEVERIANAWEKTKDLVLKKGKKIIDGDNVLIEVLDVFIVINNPERSDDENPVINPAMKQWMLSNFTDIKTVPELKNAKSYGWRLYSSNGNKIDWVINKLKNNPWSKSATVALILPEDEDYIPCVSLLDFKVREGVLLLSATCRSLDVGKKALYNFYALADIVHGVSEALKILDVKLKILIHSAHVYQKDL